VYSREFVSDNHIRRSGYLELAEENGIIMVFPQAQKRLPENEIGCWDTYGLTGPLFGSKNLGIFPAFPQILTVFKRFRTCWCRNSERTASGRNEENADTNSEPQPGEALLKLDGILWTRSEFSPASQRLSESLQWISESPVFEPYSWRTRIQDKMDSLGHGQC